MPSIVEARRAERPYICVAVAVALALAATAGLTSSAAAKPDAPLLDVSLRLDTVVRGHDAGFYVALDKGWYRDAGLNVTINQGTGAASTAQSVAAGTDTFGFVDAASELQANAAGGGLTMVANLRARNGMGIIVRRSSGIAAPAGLAGHTLAITPAGTLLWNLWPSYAEAANIDTSKVTLVPQPSSGSVTSFEDGEVDSIIGRVDVEVTQLQLAHIPVSIFLFADQGLDVLSQGIVVKQSLAHSDPELVQRFVEAMLRGWRFMLDNPNQAVGILQKYYPDLNPVSDVARIKAVKRVIITAGNAGHPLGWMSQADWGKTAFLLTKYGGIAGVPAGLHNLYTNQFIPPCRHKPARPGWYCT
jgi:NitT/TauT family transport system substrate-binding protein